MVTAASRQESRFLDFFGKREKMASAMSEDPHKQEPEKPLSVLDAATLERELDYRQVLWKQLLARGGPRDVSPQIIKELRIYATQRGIWVDKARTGRLTPDDSGASLALRHSDKLHLDDLSHDGIIYCYPKTEKEGHDRSEIAATKTAAKLGLPVFVITDSSKNSHLRDVCLGWVEDWDDEDGYFLISFEKRSSGTTSEQEDSCFQVEAQFPLFASETSSRRGEQRFKFRVFKRYGSSCAVCGLSIRELLEPTRIRPKKDHGPDDPRNGLVFCGLHCRAFDNDLFGIDPDSLSLFPRPQGPSLEELHISTKSISHLDKQPHPDFVRWRFRRWKRLHESAPE